MGRERDLIENICIDERPNPTRTTSSTEVNDTQRVEWERLRLDETKANCLTVQRAEAPCILMYERVFCDRQERPAFGNRLRPGRRGGPANPFKSNMCRAANGHKAILPQRFCIEHCRTSRYSIVHYDTRRRRTLTSRAALCGSSHARSALPRALLPPNEQIWRGPGG